jgi:hypothetical protein
MNKDSNYDSFIEIGAILIEIQRFQSKVVWENGWVILFGPIVKVITGPNLKTI